MLEGPPFAPEMAALVGSLRKTSFPDLFRDSKISIRKLSAIATTPGPSGPNATWAVTARTTAAPPSAASIHQPGPRSGGGVARNRDGYHIDRPLPPAPQNLIISMKEQKYCNFFHLSRRCPFRRCDYKHGDKLQGQELIALRHVARMGPCPTGLFCDDEACFSSHKCLKDQNCDNPKCFFPPEMHNVDIRIVTS